MNYLVKFQADYADEFEVYGFAIVSKAVFDFQMRVAELFWEENPGSLREFYFGTNEFFQYSSYEEVCRSLKVSEISDEEITTFRTFFGNDYNGSIEFGINQWIDFSDHFSDDIENLSPCAVKELNALGLKAYQGRGAFFPYEIKQVGAE